MVRGNPGLISHHRAFIARRRTERPSEEYRELTTTEWDEFLSHFELRKVALGTCGRDYATPCQHENAPLTERTLEIPQFRGKRCASSLRSLVVTNDAPERDLATLVVPRWGRLMETSDPYEPYRLLDAGGVTVEAVSVYFQELLAAYKAPATVRSYGMDLLRWWRFLQAVGVPWDRVSRVEARDFSRWIQVTAKPSKGSAAKRRSVQSGAAPNPVTGKPSAGPGYAPTTVAHSETVLRRFYDIHRDSRHRATAQPVPAGPVASFRPRARAPQPDGRVEIRARGALPAQSSAADPAFHSRGVVQRSVRRPALASRPCPGRVLDLHRGTGLGVARHPTA